MSLTLNVSHFVFLTKDQRYDLYNNKEIEIIGVSIPVWFYKNKTSEPANEVYCKYKIIPTKEDLLVKHESNSYKIYLPQEVNTKDGRTNPVTIKNLLEPQDGGISWIAFKQLGKVKKKKKSFDIFNYVEIKTIDELNATM